MKLTGRKLDDFEWAAHSNHPSLPLSEEWHERGVVSHHNMVIEHTDIPDLIHKTVALPWEKNKPAPLCISVGLKGEEYFLYLFFAGGKYCYHSGHLTHAKWFLRRLGL